MVVKTAFIILTLLLLARAAQAAPCGLTMLQRNAADDDTWERNASPATCATDSVLIHDGSTGQFSLLSVGTGLQKVGSSLQAAVAPVARVFNYPTRALNACFQPSATRDAVVSYSVDIATTLNLSGGQTGTVFLRTYNDASCSTGAQEIARTVNGNTGTLTIGLNITQNVTGSVSGMVPAGSYVRLDTSGTGTFNYRSAQEVLQ